MEKIIKTKDGKTSTISIESLDNINIRLGEEYKLIKFYSGKKQFRDTILGNDIGIHSHGFISTAILSTLIAISLFAVSILSFRI